MVQVYLSLGTNINQHDNMHSCLDVLSNTFGELTVSSIFESESVGFDGDNFYNAVVEIHTDLTVAELLEELRAIEDAHGRVRKGKRFSSRTLDIDILTYAQCHGIVDGVELPRDEVLKNAFVLWPLAEIAAEDKHPLTGMTYQQHWQAFDKASQQLWAIDFQWPRA